MEKFFGEYSNRNRPQSCHIRPSAEMLASILDGGWAVSLEALWLCYWVFPASPRRFFVFVKNDLYVS